MKRPGLLNLFFESVYCCLHFRSGKIGGLYNCNMNFNTSARFLSCSFEACLLEVRSVPALHLPVNMLLCQYILIMVSVCCLCSVQCACPGRDRCAPSITNWNPVSILIFCPRNNMLTVSQVGLITWAQKEDDDEQKARYVKLSNVKQRMTKTVSGSSGVSRSASCSSRTMISKSSEVHGRAKSTNQNEHGQLARE